MALIFQILKSLICKKKFCKISSFVRKTVQFERKKLKNRGNQFGEIGPAKCENCHNEKCKCHKCVEKTLCIVAVFIPGLCIETRLEMLKIDTAKEIKQLKNESTKNKQEIEQIKKELNAANALLKKDVQMLKNDTAKKINQWKSEITKNKQEIKQIKKELIASNAALEKVQDFLTYIVVSIYFIKALQII